MKAHQASVLPLLFDHCQSEEEGTRNVVAECLGKLALLNPNDLLPEFTNRIATGSPFTRSTLVTALKFGITDKPQPLDQVLLPHIGKFLELLKDKDLVKKKKKKKTKK
jgi:cullin-associated NEDD8-dissociated protein 1